MARRGALLFHCQLHVTSVLSESKPERVTVPYAVKRKGSKYQVVNTDTGEVKAAATTKAKAERQLHLLKGIEHGWHPTGQSDTYTRTINGKQVRLHVKQGGERSGKANR